MQIVLMRWINQAFMLGPKTWVRLITLKKQRNIQKILRISERKLSKDYFLKDVSALKMISTQFWIRFWIHSNKFHDKVFAKALFLILFSICNFWKIWFWFLLTDSSVQHILICYQAYLWSSKRYRTKFWYIWIPYMGYKS